MTSLGQRPSLEDRIRAATRAAASTVAEDGAPPLELRAPQRRASRLPTRLRRIATGSPSWPGSPWMPRLAAPLAAAAAVVAVIAVSAAVADRPHSAASSASGLAGVPRYYLELTASVTGPRATVSAVSTGPATSSSPRATTQPASPPATTQPATTQPATTHPASQPATTQPATTQPASPPATTQPATTTSPDPNGRPTTVRVDSASLGAVLGGAVIRDTLTGATLAAFLPPRGFNTFTTAAAAADDRTFVLAAQNVSESGLDPYPCGPTRLFLARFNPADGHVALTYLPVREFPASTLVDGIALSPDGTRLAVALQPSQGCSEAAKVSAGHADYFKSVAGPDEISVYSLPSGAVTTSQFPAPLDVSGQTALSFAADGTLAVNFGRQPGGTGSGFYLLNTNAHPGNWVAITDPRMSHGITLKPPAGWELNTGNGLITPDGKTLVTPIQRNLQHRGGTEAAFGEFSASTGDLVQVLSPEKVSRTAALAPDYSVVWTNPSGNVLVVPGPGAAGDRTRTQSVSGVRLIPSVQSVYGVLRGRRFTPIPGAPAPPPPPPFGSDATVVF
jgi:hypothetical protein